MLLIFIVFVVVIVLFTLGVRWGAVIIGKVLGRVVSERHHNAELITSTGQMPDAWTNPYFKQIDELQKTPGLQPDERERLIKREADKAKRRSIKGIDDLLRYFSRAPVFVDEYSRKVLLEQLESAKELLREQM